MDVAWHFTLYAGALICAGLVMLVLLALLLPHRRTPGGAPMVGLLVAMLTWTGCAALESMAVPVQWKITFSTISYLGIVAVPVFFLLFATGYSQQPQLLPRRTWTLWIIPAIIVLAAATNQWHHLLWPTFTLVAGNVLVYGHTGFFWLLVGYSYLLIFAGQVILLMAVGLYPGIYRRQLLTVCAISFIPLLGNIAYVAGASPMPGLDPAPILFSATALGLTWGVIRQDLFKLVPVAQHKVIENIQDGVLVLDLGGRVALVNSTMCHWLGIFTADTGKPVGEVLAGNPELLDFAQRPSPAQADVRLRGLRDQDFEARLAPMRSNNGEVAGQILVLRDITARRAAERASQRAAEQLAAQLATIESLQAGLREQALRDPLTGLFNRRYLDETLGRELERARRDGSPVSLVMLDADGFKGLNDRYGHAAGDDVLRHIGAIVSSRVRPGDIACRFGGDEFVVVLPGASCAAARKRADQWRVDLASLLARAAADDGGGHARSTISAGVACFPQHADSAADLMRAADKALYAAKASGRDCVAVAALTAGQPDTRQPDTRQPDTGQPDTGQPDTGEPELVMQAPASQGHAHG